MYSSMSPGRARDWISSPLPITCRSLPGSLLSSATASAASPPSNVELLQGSGSRSVLDATYFGALLSASLNGLSWVFQ